MQIYKVPILKFNLLLIISIYLKYIHVSFFSIHIPFSFLEFDQKANSSR